MAVIIADQKILGKIVRFHRKKAKLTLTELGKICGLGKTVIFDIEHGKSTVKWSTLIKIFQALNISLYLDSPLMPYFKDEGN